jgi:hypothetical protein
MRPARLTLIVIVLVALSVLVVRSRKSGESKGRIDADLEQLTGVQNLDVSRSPKGYVGTGSDRRGRRVFVEAKQREEKLIWRTFMKGPDGRTHETGGGVVPFSKGSSRK